jgi:hypothetical protein
MKRLRFLLFTPQFDVSVLPPGAVLTLQLFDSRHVDGYLNGHEFGTSSELQGP